MQKVWNIFEMVLSDSEKASSDSEVSSDEDFGESLQIALNTMKKSLKNKTESNTADFIKEHHRKIYDSFDSDDEDEVKLNEESATTRDKGEMTSLLNTFMIDKSGTNDSNSDAQQTEVFTVDLSHLEDEEANSEKKKSKKNSKKEKKPGELSSSLEVDIDVNDLYIELYPLHDHKKDKEKNQKKKLKEAEQEIMKKSVMTEDYEKQVTIPTEKSKRAEKKARKLEREKTKGSKWFNMPAQEVTEERTNDFLVYQMRRSLDPKRFYKTTDAAGIPKYYQFGTVVEHAADFYDSRIPKKQRKANMVEELLADAKFRQYNKRKFQEIQDAKRHGTGPYSTMKKLKRKKVK